MAKVSKLKLLLEKNMLIALLMGFSSGLPLLLTSRTLQAWMTQEQVDLSTIGFFSLAGLPYSLKFLWAPLFDRFTMPFLGRRRGWILVCQVTLALSIAVLAFSQPREHLAMVALLAVLVSFFSASQDIVVDAYRRESLKDVQLGMGSSFYVYGYRISMYVSNALALILASQMSWTNVYLLMAACMVVCIGFTLWSDEPAINGKAPKKFADAVVGPMKEFFARRGAMLILLFILLYKLGDTLAGAMLTPFYLKTGFSTAEIGVIAKTFGMFSTFGGLALGGALILWLGIMPCLFIFGILQGLSTFGFAILAQVGYSIPGLTAVIIFEDLSGGMGTAAFAAYMAAQTDKRFTATQYALLTSLMGVPRTILSGPTGMMAESMGWFMFFTVCALASIPGLVLLGYLQKKK